MNTLRTLSIDMTRAVVLDAAIAAVSASISLTELRFRHLPLNALSDEMLRHLSAIPALRILTFHGDAQDQITEAGIGQLLNSRTLSSLRWRCKMRALTASTLRAMGDCRTLTELYFDDRRVREYGVLSCLLGSSGSSALRRLCLPPLPAAGISSLRKFAELEVLELNYTDAELPEKATSCIQSFLAHYLMNTPPSLRRLVCGEGQAFRDRSHFAMKPFDARLYFPIAEDSSETPAFGVTVGQLSQLVHECWTLADCLASVVTSTRLGIVIERARGRGSV
jgi:hypothetical protein